MSTAPTSTSPEGAGIAGVLPGRRPRRRPEDGAVGAGERGSRTGTGERGSQTVELVLALPFLLLLLVLLLHAGVLVADLVAAQGLARETARVAAVADDDTARAALAEAVGARPVQVTIEPSDRDVGDLVVARVRLRSAAYRPFGFEVWVPGRAAMRTEDT